MTEKNTGVEEQPDTDNELATPRKRPSDANQQSAVNLHTMASMRSLP